MGILDQYKAQLALDKENENNDFPEGSCLTEEQREEYENKLYELRNDSNDMEKTYQLKKNSMTKKTEAELTESGLITEVEADKITIKHAYCDECGEELISNAPPMFNPFTFEKVCKHECKCGKIFDLDYAYPRLVVYNKIGEEIPVYTR